MNPRVQLLVDELARHRHQFEVFCRSLNEDELSAMVPNAPWTVKDYIAHLASIDGLIAAAFGPTVGLTAPAADPPLPQPFDIDDWNEAAVRQRESHDIEALIAEAGGHRDNMAAAIERMTDEDLDRVIPYGGDRKSLGLAPTPVRFGGLLWAIAIHDPTHTQDIVRALPHRAHEPWLTEWLGSVNDSIVPQGVKEQRV